MRAKGNLASSWELHGSVRVTAACGLNVQPLVSAAASGTPASVSAR